MPLSPQATAQAARYRGQAALNIIGLAEFAATYPMAVVGARFTYRELFFEITKIVTNVQKPMVIAAWCDGATVGTAIITEAEMFAYDNVLQNAIW